MPTVFIPSQLREVTDGQKTIEVEGSTVREIIAALDSRYPGIAARLCEGDDLNPSLQVAIDDAVSTRGMNTSVSPNSEVHFIPAIGGG